MEGRLEQRLAQLAKPKLLIMDEFGYLPVARQSELERTSIRTGKCSRGEAMIDAARQERKGVYCRRASIRIMI